VEVTIHPGCRCIFSELAFWPGTLGLPSGAGETRGVAAAGVAAGVAAGGVCCRVLSCCISGIEEGTVFISLSLFF
jgi:hypothetical protein